MRPYAIEIYWPGMTPALVQDLAQRASRAAAVPSAGVVYLGGTMAPHDETCFLRVTSEDETMVRRFVESLGIAGARVTELVDVPESSIGGEGGGA
jgi:hypothetical protein